jgi:type IV pilus assembly protein PilC
MPLFDFRALNEQGVVRSGTVDAVSAEAARQRLIDEGLTVLLVQEISHPTTVEDLLARYRPIKLELLVQFSRQLATMIDAGIALLRALQVLEAQERNPKFKQIVQSLVDAVQTGQPLSDAMEEHPLVFDFTYVAMVRSGEKSGELDVALKKLADQLEAELKLKRAIRSATMYPKVVAAISALIISVLVLWMVPKFAALFVETVESLPERPDGSKPDPSLPAPTQLVVDLSKAVFPSGSKDLFWFGEVALRLCGFFFALFVLAPRVWARLQTRESIRFWWDRTKLNMPLKIGDLVQKIAVARFARSFSTLMAAGLGVEEALEYTASTSGNAVIEDAVLDARRYVLAGQSIAGPLERSGVFPVMLTQMIAVGEESGELQVMLEKAAAFFEEEVDLKIKGLTTLIEPLMIVIVGLAIGFVVIVTYLPMFKLYDLIG